uniref:Uncharacterized protein LOC100182356 n=1 Tax=Phallusia mammillata TaxID=59560 RepID=A0A6F9DID9_9ASCI|nr:uncharacterized protein LOC100182356 [Phallusia mammillata]
MEESSSNPKSELCISSTSQNQNFNRGIDADFQKKLEMETQYQSSYSSLPSTQHDDDLFGIKMQYGNPGEQPPPYENNQPSVASYGTAMPITSSLMHNFDYDVLLIYDPDTDYYSAQDLLQQIEPQNLKIFDFAKECPPGASQRQVFAGALNACKYTCIVVTRNFINNFWLKFKADMAIENMMENEHKQYTLVVVVMDMALKSQHLPLDLKTLCPIFQSERFFKNRIAKAFEGIPFPISHSSLSHRPSETHPPSYHSRTSFPQRPEYKSYNDRVPWSNGPGSSFHSYQHDKDSFNMSNGQFHLPEETVRNHPESLHSASTRKSYKEPKSIQTLRENQNSASDSETSYHSQNHPTLGFLTGGVGSSIKQSASDSAITKMLERKPQEHVDSSLDSTQQYVHRLTSVTTSSTGSRQPTESDESIISRPTRHSSRQYSPSVRSFPQLHNDESLQDNSITLASAGNNKLNGTPTLAAKVDHFSFEREAVPPLRPSPVHSLQPAVEENSSGAREPENNVSSETSLDSVSLQISADDLPSVFQRTAPDQQGTKTRETPIYEERNDSVLSSLRMSYRRLKNKFK